MGYYKDKDGNLYNLKSRHKELLPISEKEFLEGLKRNELPEDVKERMTIRNKISDLKAELSATDYKCLKHVDGALTDEEYEPVKLHRAELRAQINELESSLQK